MTGIYIMDMQDHMCSIDRMQVRTLRVQHISDIEWYEEVLNSEWFLLPETERRPGSDRKLGTSDDIFDPCDY